MKEDAPKVNSKDASTTKSEGVGNAPEEPQTDTR